MKLRGTTTRNLNFELGGAMVAAQEELWDVSWGSASVASRRAPAARTFLAVAVAVAAVVPCSGLHHGPASPAQPVRHPGLAGRRGGMHASSGALRLRGGQVDVLGELPAKDTAPPVATRAPEIPWRTAALEATQGQIDGFFNQLPYKCHQNRVAPVGD